MFHYFVMCQKILWVTLISSSQFPAFMITIIELRVLITWTRKSPQVCIIAKLGKTSYPHSVELISKASTFHFPFILQLRCPGDGMPFSIVRFLSFQPKKFRSRPILLKGFAVMKSLRSTAPSVNVISKAIYSSRIGGSLKILSSSKRDSGWSWLTQNGPPG